MSINNKRSAEQQQSGSDDAAGAANKRAKYSDDGQAQASGSVGAASSTNDANIAAPSSPSIGRGGAAASATDNTKEPASSSGKNQGKGQGSAAANKGKGKGRGSQRAYKGKHKEQREWTGRDNNDEQDGGDGKSKLPKKKVALLIGYSGLGYSGSQINPGVRTIEAEVFEACVKAGCISEDNSDNANKVSLMRAARTDAGVSAAINVLNLKLILNPPSLPENTSIEEHINSFLPPAVQVWSVIRTQGSFHARTMCDSRMYNYSLPTYCFLEPKEGTLMGNRVAWVEGEKEKSYWLQQPPLPEAAESREAKEEAAGDVSTEGDKPEEGASIDAPKEPSLFRHDQSHRKAYRIPPEVLERVRSTINQFLGSHNFWNFTVGKEFGDRSCQRVMKRLTVTDPFMVNDNEWVSLKFHGQSFMLHQIRKMVGLLIMMVRTRTPPSLIPECFGPTRLNIPKAPALGLLLEQPIFENYNKKVEESNRKAEEKSLQNLGRKASKETEAKRNAAARAGAGDETMSEEGGASSVPATPTAADASKNQQQPQDDPADLIREPVSYEHIEEKVERFKREIVFKTMHGEEEKDDTYAKWLNLHDSQLGSDFDYLNAKGIIPPSAVIPKKKAAPADANGNTAKSESATDKNTNGSAQGGPKDEEDEDEEAKLAARNSGKGSFDLEG